jgi:hypothetical protein
MGNCGSPNYRRRRIDLPFRSTNYKTFHLLAIIYGCVVDSYFPNPLAPSSYQSRVNRSEIHTEALPYFRLIEQGFHLGYRKLVSRPGTWIVRRYVGGGNNTVKNLTTADEKLVIADGRGGLQLSMSPRD